MHTDRTTLVERFYTHDACNYSNGRGKLMVWRLKRVNLPVRSRSALFLLALMLFGCVFGDPAYPPVVRDETRSAVRIILKWEKGPEQPGYLPPGGACSQRVANRLLRGITVKSDEGWSRKYGPSFLARLRADTFSTSEVWLIEDRSLSLQGR
jgi:hypothetical protein